MAVRYVDETFSSGLTKTVDDKGRISGTASRGFNIFTESPQDNLAVVEADYRVPRERSGHPLFLGLYAQQVAITQKGPVYWEASVSYISSPYRDNSGPTNQPTEIETFSITNDEPIEEDVNGRAITTVNGERIYGVSRPISDLGIRLTKRFRFFDPATFYAYIDCVNSDTFFGFPAGTLRIANISASEEWADDTPYANVSIEIHSRKPYNTTNEKAWWKRVRHEGFYVRKNNRITRAKDDAGKDVVEPVMLNDDGSKLADQTQARWLEFQVFNTISFNSMGF
jgi:hypothetical protein